jgi:hypothetical protein
MQPKIKNVVRGSFLVAALSFAIVACKKDNDVVAPLSLPDESASVPVSFADTIRGRWANPASGPMVFGTVYYNVITGAKDTTGGISYNLRFTGFNNSTINKATATSTDTLRYLNTTTPLALISLSQYASATAVTTLGQNTTTNAANTSLNANGWWTYDTTTHQVTYTQNVVVFYRAAGSANIYAFKFNGAWGEGIATLNRGVYALRRGRVQ